MKFGQSLLEASQLHPEWQQYFVSYKRLKSLLSSMTKAGGGALARDGPAPEALVRSVSAIVQSLEEAFESVLESVRLCVLVRAHVHVCDGLWLEEYDEIPRLGARPSWLFEF